MARDKVSRRSARETTTVLHYSDGGSSGGGSCSLGKPTWSTSSAAKSSSGTESSNAAHSVKSCTTRGGSTPSTFAVTRAASATPADLRGGKASWCAAGACAKVAATNAAWPSPDNIDQSGVKGEASSKLPLPFISSLVDAEASPTPCKTALTRVVIFRVNVPDGEKGASSDDDTEFDLTGDDVTSLKVTLSKAATSPLLTSVSALKFASATAHQCFVTSFARVSSAARTSASTAPSETILDLDGLCSLR
mmetsp:Transcript_5146/g.14914  ORF Transcript_5146/g.14914 Transcript_5146/m.14914 type:complete len:249 (-) Transcript_5146:4285-5031(-)